MRMRSTLRIPRILVPASVLVALAILGFMLMAAGPAGLAAFGLAGAGATGMLMDELTEFCDATALDTGGTGRVLIGDVMDLGAAGRDIGTGQQVFMVIEVDTAVTSGGSATVSFELSSDAQAAIAVDATETIHFATYAIPKATLVAGYKIVFPLPGGTPAYERYLGIVQNVGTAALTAGKINAFLTTDASFWKAYANATNS